MVFKRISGYLKMVVPKDVGLTKIHCIFKIRFAKLIIDYNLNNTKLVKTKIGNLFVATI